MKKLFSEAEVELTLISALEDILTASGDRGDLGSVPDNGGWEEP